MCWFPCLCEACHEIVEVNLLAGALRCPKCGSDRITAYDDPTVRPERLRGTQPVAEWDMERKLGRQLVLTNEQYRCPKCGKQSLQVAMSALRD